MLTSTRQPFVWGKHDAVPEGRDGRHFPNPQGASVIFDIVSLRLGPGCAIRARSSLDVSRPCASSGAKSLCILRIKWGYRGRRIESNAEIIIGSTLRGVPDRQMRLNTFGGRRGEPNCPFIVKDSKLCFFNERSTSVRDSYTRVIARKKL